MNRASQVYGAALKTVFDHSESRRRPLPHTLASSPHFHPIPPFVRLAISVFEYLTRVFSAALAVSLMSQPSLSSIGFW